MCGKSYMDLVEEAERAGAYVNRNYFYSEDDLIRMRNNAISRREREEEEDRRYIEENDAYDGPPPWVLGRRPRRYY